MIKAFNKIKLTLAEAPAPDIPNLNKPFSLYIAEKQGIAFRVLVQRLGNKAPQVSCFSKKLDSAATGWPPCLRAC